MAGLADFYARCNSWHNSKGINLSPWEKNQLNQTFKSVYIFKVFVIMAIVTNDKINFDVALFKLWEVLFTWLYH